MGRGFGRGARSVGVVTHAQVKGAKKMPKGLRGSRKSRRRQYKGEQDEQAQLEQSMGVSKPPVSSDKRQNKSEEEGGKRPQRTLAQEIAGIHFQQVIHGKRQKGFKSLRKQLLASVKDVRRRYTEKQRNKNKKQEELLAARHEALAERHTAAKRSGNARRSKHEEAAEAAAAASSAAESQAASNKQKPSHKQKRSRSE